MKIGSSLERWTSTCSWTTPWKTRGRQFTSTTGNTRLTLVNSLNPLICSGRLSMRREQHTVRAGLGTGSGTSSWTSSGSRSGTGQTCSWNRSSDSDPCAATFRTMKNWLMDWMFILLSELSLKSFTSVMPVFLRYNKIPPTSLRLFFVGHKQTDRHTHSFFEF